MTVDLAMKNNAGSGTQWRGFHTGKWMKRVDVRDFIERNITPYEGDGRFLAGPTPNTKALWEIIDYDQDSIIIKDLEQLKAICRCENCPEEICRI